MQRKTRLVGNGINVDLVPLKKTAAWPAKEFVLIGVGSLSDWHGFDRVIRGISNFKRTSSSGLNVRFLVVGDGAARKEWEKLARELNVTDSVIFLGPQTGAGLDICFDQAHVAVASLGLYRKGLSMASDLKSREYAARGMPFLAGGDDIDFQPAPPFVLKVANRNEDVSIQGILAWYERIEHLQDAMTIRDYAQKHLDFKVKIKDYLK